VMIVDDDTDNADLLTKLLVSWGYSARVAYTGSFLLKVAAEFRPAAFLVDLGMRDMDGFRLAETIRRDPAQDNAKLVAITGFGDQSHRARAETAGFAHFFVKPVDLSQLRSVLAEIDQRRLGDASG
ncbi:MAG TPA: response regulator, partial [Pirellulales bacterium]|nr:response regulator [Pirellulales bacterium]